MTTTVDVSFILALEVSQKRDIIFCSNLAGRHASIRRAQIQLASFAYLRRPWLVGCIGVDIVVSIIEDVCCRLLFCYRRWRRLFCYASQKKKRRFKTCVRVEDGQQSLEKYVKWDLMCTWKHVQDIKLWPVWRDGINVWFLSFPHVFASSLHCQFRFLAEPGCCFEFFSIPMWFAFS